MLKREEILWRDKAKFRWIEEGDANTRFFHLSPIIHRRCNSINSILWSNNTWLTKRQKIGMTFQNYFTTLFTTCDLIFPEDFQSLIRLCITLEENNSLNMTPTEEEIRKAIFTMGSNKSPGPDDMATNFYKAYWSIVKATVISVVQRVFTTAVLKGAHNHTFLALIPKSNMASRVDLFRPIALCNVFLKVITKIFANRLWPLLDWIVHPCQSVFIPNRSINDNIIINHEVMHYLKGKKRQEGIYGH